MRIESMMAQKPQVTKYTVPTFQSIVWKKQDDDYNDNDDDDDDDDDDNDDAEKGKGSGCKPGLGRKKPTRWAAS